MFSNLSQETINAGCEVSYRRYVKAPIPNLAFAYDLQGYLQLLVKDREYSLAEARAFVVELLDLVEEANS